MRKHLCSLLVLWFCFSLRLFGQAQGIGTYLFASFDTRGFDSVNVGNLNVRFSIPIVNRTGRGIPFNYALQYEGLVWANSGGVWAADPAWGFRGSLNGVGLVGYMTHATLYFNCAKVNSGPPPKYTELKNYVYHDPFGGTHTFDYDYTSSCDGGSGPGGNDSAKGTGGAKDGSGYSIDPTLMNPTQVKTRSGSVITPGQSATGLDTGNVTDSNGNQVNVTSGATFSDTLGVTALTIAGTSPRTFTYPVTRQSNNATTAQVTLSYRNYTVRTYFQCANIGESGSATTALPDRVTLADGSYYAFAYEGTPSATDGAVTGRLASVTLPTGGTISYSYSGGCGAGMVADGTVGTLTRTTSDGTRTYTRATVNASATTTTVQDEKGNQTYYAFSVDAASHTFFETHRKAYQGSISSGSLLLDQYTCYNGAVASCDGASLTLPVSEQDVTVSYNGGSQVLTKNSYDTNGTLLTGSVVSSGGSTLMSVGNSYNPSGELTATSSSDPSGNPFTYSSYGYDEGSVTTTSGVPHHITPSGARGNLTSTHTSAGPTYLNTSTTYYDTGVPVNMTAVDGGVTTYGYDSTQGFVTSTKLPIPISGVALSTSAQYDAGSASLLSNTGMNGDSTTINNYDALMRPINVSLPSGSQITATITGPTHSFVYQTLDGSRTAQKETLLDGYGRLSRLNTYNGQSTNNYYQVDYCYDASGLLQFQSSPYQSTGINVAKHCSGSGTAYVYDALGRTTSVTTDDGTSTTKYLSRAVQTTDVNSVSKITQYDLLGRISSVCEISSTTYASVAPAACGSEIAGTGFLTTYAYALVQHVTTITQGGQTRSFVTDPAGRPTSTTEPERGTTSYSYAFSNGLQVTRTRPQANQTGSATTNTTTQYDLLGRVVTTSYSDGTATRNFFYDTDDPSGGWSSAATNPKGRLTAVRTSSNTRAQFMHDVSGNVTSMQQCTAGTCGTGNQQGRPLSFGYDLANTLNYEFDGAAGGISYGLSVAEEVTSVKNLNYNDTGNPPNLVSNVVNGPTGPISYTLGNGLNVYDQYDNTGRTNARWLCRGPAQNNCPTQLYGTDLFVKGSRATGSDDTALGGYAAYSYDDLNRLAAVNRTNGSQPVFGYTYSYDRYGNRTAATQTAGNSRPTSTLNYALSNHITNTGYSYDAAGNLLTDGSHSYSYDAEGNIVTVDNGNTARYTYDALNRRVSVTNPSGSTDYTYDAAGQRISSWVMPQNFGSEGRIYMNGSLLAYRSIDGTTVYSAQDVLGTERMRTNYAGAILDTFKSLPFGDGYTFGTGSAGSATYQDSLHFSELDHDTETSTEHATYRQYSSNDGRWMMPDPYNGSYDATNPQSFNRYVYALNNPVRLLDPLGLQCGSKAALVPVIHAYDDDGGCENDGNGGSAGGGSAPTPGCEPNCSDQNGTDYTPNGNGGISGGSGGSTGVDGCDPNDGCYKPGPWGWFSSGGPLGRVDAPNNGRPKTKRQCALEALNNNKVALGLDVAGVGAGFLPGGDLVVAGVQATISVASGINGAVQYNGTANSAAGSVLGVLGLPATFTSYAAKAIGVGGKALPGVGAVISGLGALSDAYGTYTDYQSCLVGH